MVYRSESIAVVVDRLNRQYFLPAIQREFVWLQPQIIQLFDSVMRGYPISSFLFWELKPENRDKWEVYKFIDNFREKGTHNELASTDGVQQLTLVLDGQQRLTSLLIGLKGSFIAKRKYIRRDSSDAWIKQSLYLDLLKGPKLQEEDSEMGIRYGFTFADKAPANQPGQYWLKVGRILDMDTEDKFYTFLQEVKDKLPDEVTKGQITTFERNLKRLWDTIWKDEIISYYTEHDQDYDRVLDIFIRANDGGTKLTKSDLLLSLVTSKWKGMNARQDITDFVDRLNTELTRKNAFDKDFVMKTCLVLSDLPVQYRVNNFSVKNLILIQNKWERIKQATETSVDLVNTFGIDRDTLTSVNALIPIVYYLSKHSELKPGGTTQFDVNNSASIRRWLIAVMLNGAFGGSSDNILTDIRDTLNSADATIKDFPVAAINETIAQSGRKAVFDDISIDDFLSIKYGQQLAFLAISILYDEYNWGVMPYHQDHIFPRARFSISKMDDAGIPGDKQMTYLADRDKIGNLELLLSTENEEKSNQDFEKWLSTRDSSFKKRHLIPDDPKLYHFDMFEEFLGAREKLIRERLSKLFSHP